MMESYWERRGREAIKDDSKPRAWAGNFSTPFPRLRFPASAFHISISILCSRVPTHFRPTSILYIYPLSLPLSIHISVSLPFCPKAITIMNHSASLLSQNLCSVQGVRTWNKFKIYSPAPRPQTNRDGHFESHRKIELISDVDFWTRNISVGILGRVIGGKIDSLNWSQVWNRVDHVP
jgi:hypothetical protein